MLRTTTELMTYVNLNSWSFTTIHRIMAVVFLFVFSVAVQAQDSPKQEDLSQAIPVDEVVVIDSTAGDYVRGALRTNLLYDAALIPNLGIEVPLSSHLSAGIDAFYTWFSSDHRHRYWQSYGAYMTFRYYFKPWTLADRQATMFTGHHLGIYGLCLTYDVEWGGRGYQASKFGFGGGVEYGYSMPVSRCLLLDFSLGIGFQDGEYKEYLPTDDYTGHYVWQATKKRHWFGPTKAEVSLKWQIGKGKKVKKGVGR